MHEAVPTPLSRRRVLARVLVLLLALALGWPAGSRAAPGLLPKGKPAPPPPKEPEEPGVDTRFAQVFPDHRAEGFVRRSAGRNRAVILLAGLKLHPFNGDYCTQPEFHTWENPGSVLVTELGKTADVFAFAYSENDAIEEIARMPDLPAAVRRVRELGYTEVVLVGHSAGGLVARQFVEDHPDAGVTKVVQVCTPNTGCGYARFQTWLPAKERPFLASLTREGRARFLSSRAGKPIPPGVQFVCVIGDSGRGSDGVVAVDSQWPRDLQNQGIPAIRLWTTHFTVMRTRAEAEQLAKVIAEKSGRWGSVQVTAARKAWGWE